MREGSPGDPAGSPLTSTQGKEPSLRGARSLEGWRVLLQGLPSLATSASWTETAPQALFQKHTFS